MIPYSDEMMGKYLTMQLLQVKELESQLLIERKLARQHVDNKIAENQQQQKQKQQEPPYTSLYTPISRPWQGKNQNYEAAENLTTIKELGNETRPLSEHNSNNPVPAPCPDNNNILRNFPFLKDKENRPELAEEPAQRNAGRGVSLYFTAPEIPIFPAYCRNSLVPLPRKASRVSLGGPAAFPGQKMSSHHNSLIPLPSAEVTLLPKPGNITSTLLLPLHCAFEGENENNSQLRRSNKKLDSILRRSLQKKVFVRSPLPQTVKRRAMAGLENVRVSIGGSGRTARRVVVRDGMRRAERGGMQKWQKDKERGWNHRTASRNVF